ncbi:helix-turn-helix domain-containing protein [Polymorphospora rubra]|uniref:helix-turn-helix domain-containing protein n=1 Tax=Polymorphospora rubra TaxID=338584 RepID=UPI001BB3D871|nr:helix-turn-helix transcriptional regulator [Polymorphospora rubra]
MKKTLRAQWLGIQLRDLRVERGMTLQEAASFLRYDYSSLGRFERAELPFKHDDVVALLDLYGVFDAQDRARLRQLCTETWRSDQWDVDFSDAVYDSTFVDYLWLEEQATTIRLYDTAMLHVLLQTRAYAEASVRLVEGPKVRPERVARWVDRRMERQRVVEAGRTRLSVVVDEAVLRRPFGDARVMREQLTQLTRLARERDVEIRVLPPDATLRPQVFGAFTLFEMPDPYPEVAYLENLAGRFYLEAPRSQRFAYAYDQLCEAALDPAESAKLIAATAHDWS